MNYEKVVPRQKKEQDFQTVFEAGHSVANRNFVVYQLEKPGQKHFRVGLSVGKKKWVTQ